MKKLLGLPLIAVIFFACSGKSTDAGEQQNSDTAQITLQMLSGSYEGYFSGTEWVHSPLEWQPYFMQIKFVSDDSTFSWTNGLLGPYDSEWGAGWYTIVGDSLEFHDTQYRTQERTYRVIHYRCRFSFADDILTFFTTVDDSLHQVVVLEKVK